MSPTPSDCNIGCTCRQKRSSRGPGSATALEFDQSQYKLAYRGKALCVSSVTLASWQTLIFAAVNMFQTLLLEPIDRLFLFFLVSFSLL